MSGGLELWRWITWVFVLAGAGVTLWVLIGRRAKGPHCSKCGYSMEGARVDAASLPAKCPECGREARRPRDLLCRERKWARVWIVTALLLIAYGASIVPRVLRRGWVGAIPTPALVVMMPWMSPEWHDAGGAPPGVLRDEAEERLKDGEMYGVWGWMWGERTRWTFGRSRGWRPGDAETLRVLASTRFGPQETATVRQAFEQVAETCSLELSASWADSDDGTQPTKVSRSIPLTCAQVLDGACAEENSVFAMYAWTVRGRNLHIVPQSEAASNSVFKAHALSAATDACFAMWRRLDVSASDARLRIADCVRSVVNPAGWVENGGASSRLAVIGGRMIVVADARSQASIVGVLQALIGATPEQPLCTEDREDDLALARLVRKETVRDLPESETLAALSEMVADAIRAPCLIDDATRPPLIDTSRVPLPRGGSIGAVLSQALESLGPFKPGPFVWTTSNGSVLLSSRDRRTRGAITRVYAIGDLLEVPEPVDLEQFWDDVRNHPSPIHFAIPHPADDLRGQVSDLCTLLATTIEPELWWENGGDEVGSFEIGDRILIHGPASIHVQVEELLAGLRGARARGEDWRTTDKPE
ncbi:hypothetical protein PHYC_00358 [Phycisphaerales bacterium]|nr:hypothetical protein PHYC_00358 [Phycisphaerales bacterium]